MVKLYPIKIRTHFIMRSICYVMRLNETTEYFLFFTSRGLEVHWVKVKFTLEQIMKTQKGVEV
jgi:hypothetical protein